VRIFSGTIKGKISKKPMGKKRFDWDRIFIPSGFSKTFAQMDLSEKNRISHRMKAFKKLKRFLSSEIK
jgi:XTP/dITP diphosphohydrolase